MRGRMALFLVILVSGIPLMVGSSGEKPAVLLIARGETSAQAIGVAGLQMMI